MCDDGHAIQSIYCSLSMRHCCAWLFIGTLVVYSLDYLFIILLILVFFCWWSGSKRLCHDLAAMQHCFNMCRIFHSKTAFLSMLLGHRSLVTFPVVEFVLSESSLGMPSCVELIIVNILRLKLLVLFLR